MDFFRSGTCSIEAGVVEKTVSGLSLPFTPAQVIVSVRQPSASSDLITAFVTGTPAADGFSVAFSSTVPADGYMLDWCASTGSASPESSGTLAADYNTIQEALARYLGYNKDALTTEQSSEIDFYIQSGLRQFYFPPKMDGVDENHEWSFMKLKGSVATETGVGEYILADGFGRVTGDIVFGGDDIRMHPLAIISTGAMLAIRGRGEKGPPRFAALSPSSEFGLSGQRMVMSVYPVPDRVYSLEFRGDADVGRLDPSSNRFPLGGPRFSELVIESCLAIAEQRANDETSGHTEKFHQLMISMIAKDRKATGAVFGQMGDHSDIPPPYGRPVVWGGMKITYRGRTW